MSKIIDTRDLHDRLAELEEAEELEPDEAEELAELQTMRDEITDWLYGETLIPDDEFTDYAQELGEELGGDQLRKAEWPFMHIDWEAAANNLRQDYSEFTYQGTTYLARA